MRPRRRGGSTPTMHVWKDTIHPHICLKCRAVLSRAVLVKGGRPVTFDGEVMGCPVIESTTGTRREIALVDLSIYPTHAQTCRGAVEPERTK